jgi:threonine dehydrogenase-like Zn-dependent dehydrogenase
MRIAANALITDTAAHIGSNRYSHAEYKNGYPTASEETPLTLGHEISGDIVEVGAAVDFYQVGMRVPADRRGFDLY